MDTAEDVMTDQEILDKLNEWHQAGLFSYVLPSVPLGEEWVVGQDGMILKFPNKAQVVAFISGCNCVLRTFAKRAGMSL